MEKALVIIDGNSLMNRAYYAIQRPMITGDGMYTQGIFGFLNMLNKILTDYEPEYISVAFDRKAPTFRHLEYKEYKAGRKKMPPELAMQFPVLKEILSAMKIDRIEIDGFEADDIIGTVAVTAEREGARDGVQHRGFARAVAADDRDKVAVLQRQIQSLQGDLLIDGSCIEGFVYILDLKHCPCLPFSRVLW